MHGSLTATEPVLAPRRPTRAPCFSFGSPGAGARGANIPQPSLHSREDLARRGAGRPRRPQRPGEPRQPAGRVVRPASRLAGRARPPHLPARRPALGG